ncbi:MAG: CoA transferase, partial [Candidatus Tectomicrobia bacterium]|nr:CoA transferase [Candidatus Tectomicrobia bacterium]
MKKEEFYQEVIRDSRGPLEGLKVLEATTTGAGPWTGALLTDLGAGTIKIDQPEVGDISRHIPPFVPGPPKMEAGTLHLSINRGKKCITLNLKSPQGQAIFRELAAGMDVVVQNYKPGTMDEWGLGYRDIGRVKADIVYTSVSGFGQYGPLSYRPGYDPVGQAMGGLMSVTGFPEGPPTRAGFAIADNMTAWLGAFATVSALLYREKTGRGQHVDVNLLDSILYSSQSFIMAAANAGYVAGRSGNRSPLSAPSDLYRCKDGGHIRLVAGLDSHWVRLCQLMGREDLAEDPRLQNRSSRAENAALVEESVREWVQDFDQEEVVGILDEAGLVVAPVLNFSQILENEHVLAREMVVEVDHPLAGKLKLYGVGAKFSRTPGRVQG